MPVRSCGRSVTSHRAEAATTPTTNPRASDRDRQCRCARRQCSKCPPPCAPLSAARRISLNRRPSSYRTLKPSGSARRPVRASRTSTVDPASARRRRRAADSRAAARPGRRARRRRSRRRGRACARRVERARRQVDQQRAGAHRGGHERVVAAAVDEGENALGQRGDGRVRMLAERRAGLAPALGDGVRVGQPARCRPEVVHGAAQGGLGRRGGRVEVVLDGDESAAGVAGEVADRPDAEPGLRPVVRAHRRDESTNAVAASRKHCADGGRVGARHPRNTTTTRHDRQDTLRFATRPGGMDAARRAGPAASPPDAERGPVTRDGVSPASSRRPSLHFTASGAGSTTRTE